MATELLAGRIVAPFFGGSIYVWGAVITVFMLALALGYLCGGRFSLTLPACGVSVHCSPSLQWPSFPVVLFGERVLEGLSATVPDPRYGTLLACVALFFLPTLLSGMVSPYAVRLLVTQTATSGASAGWLYFVIDVRQRCRNDHHVLLSGAAAGSESDHPHHGRALAVVLARSRC